MRKLFTIATIASLFFAGTVMAGSIFNTKHDFADSSYYTPSSIADGNDEVCAYCHTPHGSNTAAVPLFNKNVTTATYTAYGTTLGNTTVDATAPGGTSLLCLSCHDGSIAPGTVLNAPNRGFTQDSDKVTGSYLLNKDFRDDHPIGFTWVDGKVAKNKADLTTTYPLFNDKMECATCHDVHDNDNAPFLVASNAASAMCQHCHAK